jgi:hypothetical protein
MFYFVNFCGYSIKLFTFALNLKSIQHPEYSIQNTEY